MIYIQTERGFTMNSLSDEIQLIARLEIENILDNNELGGFAVAIEESFHFPMVSLISEYFVQGAAFGAVADDSTSELDKDLFLLDLNEEMRELLENSAFKEKNQPAAIEVFEKIFVQGFQWSVIHKRNNE